MGVIPIELQGIDQWIACILAIIAGLIVQGEAQLYFVHMFEVFSQRTKIVYDLNPASHVDASSIPVLLLAGWGWTKRRVEEPDYFPPSPTARAFVPLAGPVGNLLLAGIIGSVHYFLSYQVLAIAIAINVQMAIANFLVPVPPMALGRALCRRFDASAARQYSLEHMGAIVLASILIIEHFLGVQFLRFWLLEVSARPLKWVLGH